MYRRYRNISTLSWVKHFRMEAEEGGGVEAVNPWEYVAKHGIQRKASRTR